MVLKVECIDEDPLFPKLIKGETYAVAYCVDEDYVIIDEDHEHNQYPKDIFKIVKGPWGLVLEGVQDSIKNIFNN